MFDENLRRVAYKTFSKLFYYPDEELAGFFSEGIISEFFNELNLEGTDNNQFQKWIDSFEDREENSILEELQVEYTRLFINSFPSLPAPPFKSYYNEKELIGVSTEKTIETYEKFNFGISKSENEIPDHIAVELEFIYRLIEEDIDIDHQIKFLNEDIMNWIESFRNKIIESASIPIYPYLINTLIKYLEEDIKQYEKLTGAEL